MHCLRHFILFTWVSASGSSHGAWAVYLLHFTANGCESPLGFQVVRFWDGNCICRLRRLFQLLFRYCCIFLLIDSRQQVWVLLCKDCGFQGWISGWDLCIHVTWENVLLFFSVSVQKWVLEEERQPEWIIALLEQCQKLGKLHVTL